MIVMYWGKYDWHVYLILNWILNIYYLQTFEMNSQKYSGTASEWLGILLLFFYIFQFKAGEFCNKLNAYDSPKILACWNNPSVLLYQNMVSSKPLKSQNKK